MAEYRLSTALALSLIATVSALSARQPASAFEVVSVRQNLSGERTMRVRMPADHFEATNIQIRELIRLFHGLQDFQLVGGPEWLTTERYDIIAKADRAYQPGPRGGST